MKEFDESWAEFEQLHRAEQKSADGYYLCWNEADFAAVLYSLLRPKLKNIGMSVHLGVRRGMRFNNACLQENWAAWKRKKRMGDIDLLICRASEKNFELAVELKYLHTVERDLPRGGYPATTDARSAELLKRKLASQYMDLHDLQQLGAAREVCVAVVDAYYHRKGMLESRILPDSIPKNELKFLKG